jgi:hypothetical protein
MDDNSLMKQYQKSVDRFIPSFKHVSVDHSGEIEGQMDNNEIIVATTLDYLIDKTGPVPESIVQSVLLHKSYGPPADAKPINYLSENKYFENFGIKRKKLSDIICDSTQPEENKVFLPGSLGEVYVLYADEDSLKRFVTDNFEITAYKEKKRYDWKNQTPVNWQIQDVAEDCARILRSKGFQGIKNVDWLSSSRRKPIRYHGNAQIYTRLQRDGINNNRELVAESTYRLLERNPAVFKESITRGIVISSGIEPGGDNAKYHRLLKERYLEKNTHLSGEIKSIYLKKLLREILSTKKYIEIRGINNDSTLLYLPENFTLKNKTNFVQQNFNVLETAQSTICTLKE